MLGIEPLSPGFDGEWLYAATRGRAAPIKPMLMDSHLLVGVGNIYASEALFRAGINPKKLAFRVQGDRAEKLAAAIKEVLLEAIAAGGSSLRDYVQTDGELGYFQKQWRVYDREGEVCHACGDAKGIRRITQGGRSTFYCTTCQK